MRPPEGAFFAWGAAGQYALVIPALDIVVVHRVDRDIADYKEVNLWQFGRLLWLILSAAHQPDIGPDVSLQAAKGQRLDDAALASMLQNATFERLPVRASGMTEYTLTPTVITPSRAETPRPGLGRSRTPAIVACPSRSMTVVATLSSPTATCCVSTIPRIAAM